MLARVPMLPTGYGREIAATSKVAELPAISGRCGKPTTSATKNGLAATAPLATKTTSAKQRRIDPHRREMYSVAARSNFLYLNHRLMTQ
jgi:hypothetical protein